MFLSSKAYSIHKSVERGLTENGIEVYRIHYSENLSKAENLLINFSTRLPQRINKATMSYIVRKINNIYLKLFKLYDPDIIFIYNNQLLEPATLSDLKSNAKIVFYLGDNPLYSQTSIYNLHILFLADYIICPDSFWISQLEKMGIKNIVFDCFSFDSDVYYPFAPGNEEKNKYQSDLVYVGVAHKTNWGYKRFLFLDKFKKFNLKAFMNKDVYNTKWAAFFPGLKSKIIPHNRYDQVFNNIVYNCSKICPVDLVPSLFHGVHIRVFDSLGSGIFPLCEYSPDLIKVFEGIDFPYINNYEDAETIAESLLNADLKRKDLIQKMRTHVMQNYAPKLVIRRMLDYLKI
jgi:spore maturation protein CgeB